MKNQTAILPTQNVNDGHNYHGEKEMIDSLSLVAFHKGEFRDVITVRVHVAKNKGTIFVSVWILGGAAPKPAHIACRGKAGGWGYHRPSAAMGNALRRAGVELAYDIDGVGDQAMTETMIAIGRALGYPRNRLHVVKG